MIHVLIVIAWVYAGGIVAMAALLLWAFRIARRDASKTMATTPPMPTSAIVVGSLVWPGVLGAYVLGKLHGARVRRAAERNLAMSDELRDGMRKLSLIHLGKTHVRLQVALDVAAEARRGDDELAVLIADADLETVRREVYEAERLVHDYDRQH